MRIGIDVGGTHTDAVLMQGEQLLASTKAVTSADVVSGVVNALTTVLQDAQLNPSRLQAVMIGTTQFTNAVVERKNLSQVAAIRIGLPSGADIPPMTDWPADIAAEIGTQNYLLHGGYLYDGWPLADIDDDEVKRLINDLKSKKLQNIAITSAFSPMNAEPERQLASLLSQHIPEARITLSHTMGRLGILERENASILNAALVPFANRVVGAFQAAMASLSLRCPMFISQNDGTLMNADFVRRYPAMTFASGPTNSLRGASKLTGLQDAIVVDIGGTTSDIGVLQHGFPRESNQVIDVGGVRTNFRMPDINAVALGGGSIVSDDGRCIGPQSVGHDLLTKGLCFGGNTLTATDILVASGAITLGNPALLSNIPQQTINNAIQHIHSLLDKNIDMMKPNSDPVPVIVVGGGSILVSKELPTASTIIRPEHASVANAIGAAIANVGGEAEQILSYRQINREDAIAQVTSLATQAAVSSGASAATIKVMDIEETAIPYMDDGNTRLRVKVVGEVADIPREEVA